MREDLVKKVKNSLSAEQNVFKKPVQQTENAVTASFIVVLQGHLLMENL